MNKVKLSQIIRDFIITLDGDDYVSNASDVAIRNFARVAFVRSDSTWARRSSL